MVDVGPELEHQDAPEHGTMVSLAIDAFSPELLNQPWLEIALAIWFGRRPSTIFTRATRVKVPKRVERDCQDPEVWDSRINGETNEAGAR
jgi:hypothetical protein